MRRLLMIWGKELLDTLRDRRTLAVMTLVPVLLMPLLALLPQALIRGQIEEQQETALLVEVYGAANGPALVDYLRLAGAEVSEVTADPRALVREQKSSVVLVIPPSFASQIAAQRPAQVILVLNESNIRANLIASRVEDLVDRFAQGVAARWLVERGLNPVLLDPLQVVREDAASHQQMGGVFLGTFMPMFLILFAFLGGMYTAIDVTAGEKERGTLEPLLVAPVGRTEVVLGKLLAVFATSFGAVILALLSTYAAFQILPHEFFGRDMSSALPLSRILWLVVAALPFTLLLNGIEMSICLFARSFKEAQNYITPLQLLLMLPAFVVGLLPGFQAPGWAYAVPALAQMAIFRDILSGAALDYGHLGLSLATAGLGAALAIAGAVQVFRRESVLFRT